MFRAPSKWPSLSRFSLAAPILCISHPPGRPSLHPMLAWPHPPVSPPRTLLTSLFSAAGEAAAHIAAGALAAPLLQLLRRAAAALPALEVRRPGQFAQHNTPPGTSFMFASHHTRCFRFSQSHRRLIRWRWRPCRDWLSRRPTTATRTASPRAHRACRTHSTTRSRPSPVGPLFFFLVTFVEAPSINIIRSKSSHLRRLTTAFSLSHSAGVNGLALLPELPESVQHQHQQHSPSDQCVVRS